jgi:hypothetical protein
LPAAVLDLPPSAIHAPAPSTGRVTAVDAQKALERLKAANPGTQFVSAEPSQVPGLVKVTLAGGKLAYADKSGRYLILGVIFDMHVGTALDGALDAVPLKSSGDSND